MKFNEEIHIPRKLKKKEYFDHINSCEMRSVIWINGDAYCPECGIMGAVYEEKKKETSK